MKRLFKRGVVLALVAIVLFCRGQGYEWTLSVDDAAQIIYDKSMARDSCFRRYNEAAEYDRLLRCQADADKLIRDKFKWW